MYFDRLILMADSQIVYQGVANQAGGAIGGNALKALNDYSQGSASTEYGNAFNRFQTGRTNIYNTLAGIAGIGQTAQGQTNQMAQNVAGSMGQAAIGSANAQAAGQIGAANAYGGALENAANMYSMSKFLRPGGISFNQQSPVLGQGVPMSGGGMPDFTVG